MSTTYVPRPIETNAVPIDESVRNLLEQLAENVHDTWASRRMAEGWRYGPVRDSRLRTHPCLVPYQDLPDEEQEYDRQTALATVRTILALGYDIRKKE